MNKDSFVEQEKPEIKKDKSDDKVKVVAVKSNEKKVPKGQLNSKEEKWLK